MRGWQGINPYCPRLLIFYDAVFVFCYFVFANKIKAVFWQKICECLNINLNIHYYFVLNTKETFYFANSRIYGLIFLTLLKIVFTPFLRLLAEWFCIVLTTIQGKYIFWFSFKIKVLP